MEYQCKNKSDRDANGVGWLIDKTLLDNSKFIAHDTDSYLLAAAESEAEGKYDLLNVSFVFLDNDGQFSEPATVEVTVENAIPEIVEVQIPDSIVEGTKFTIDAIAINAGNDELTYIWELDNRTTLKF